MQGYFRHRIKGHIFPGVQPAEPHDEITGLVRLQSSLVYTALYTARRAAPERNLPCACSGVCTDTCIATCADTANGGCLETLHCGDTGAARP